MKTKLAPVITKLKDSYGLWQKYFAIFPKANRFTLGSKIDQIFLSTIEYCFLASYANQTEKSIFMDKGISRLDLLKLLIQLAWEIKAITSNDYITISQSLSEAGQQLGGWKKSTLQKTPAK
ncbi:MAG: four helix bundle protein [Candidatus Taylorbacteria bacterium]|nr:four helix bundle protein [Candidatus Taylorbacteria bacterium]